MLAGPYFLGVNVVITIARRNLEPLIEPIDISNIFEGVIGLLLCLARMTCMSQHLLNDT